MKINAQLDVNIVALETSDEVAVLLDLEAPSTPSGVTRPPASLQVVLDRSGSMSGAPLQGAKQALVALVRRLEPTDNFGLVTFDDSAEVVVPAGPLLDKERIVRMVEGITAGGSTDLSAGYLRGLREIRRVAGETGGTILVISDGHVNSGLRHADEFSSVAAQAYTHRVVTSTLGYGRGYDETLLSAISRAGSGNHVFADDPDAAGAAIAGDVEGLLNKVVQALSLTIRFEPRVDFLRLFNDLPAHQIGDGKVMVELGDLYAQEGRSVLLKFRIPGMSTLGPTRIATLELAYVELPGMVEHVATLPINVNIVPGDIAAGRVADAKVVSEVLFQEAQDVKRRASEAFERTDYAEGQRLIELAREQLTRCLEVAPEELKPGIWTEIQEVTSMVLYGQSNGPAGTAYMSKVSRESFHRGNRKRGREPEQPGQH